MVVSGMVFAISAGTRNLTINAQALHIADDTLRVATAARAQVGFANHLAGVEREFGLDVTEEQSVSAEQARLAIDAVISGVHGLDDTVGLQSADTLAAAEEFAAISLEILGLIDAGESATANMMVADDLEQPYVRMFESIESERGFLLNHLENADALMARLGDVARFLVVLLIPLAVIFIYREIVRRMQRQAELELRLQAEKEIGKARDDFVANASHEFRTPLTSIYGFSQIIEDDEDVPDATREIAGLISTEAADLFRMVEDLLTTARLDAGALTYQLEPVDAFEVADEVIRSFQQGPLELEVEVQPVAIYADALRSRQVLRNLVSNALKYGGPIVRVSGRTASGWYLFTVADNGSGVPVELEDRLFQRFMHRGTQFVVPGGVGLGLSIVRSLADGMGGAVAYRRVNDWSYFDLRLPLAVTGHAGASPPGGALQVAASIAVDGLGT